MCLVACHRLAEPYPHCALMKDRGVKLCCFCHKRCCPHLASRDSLGGEQAILVR